jgi:hypothetical protein
MILLIRFILISLIIYLLVRSFARYVSMGDDKNNAPGPDTRDLKGKKVSKEVGEYVDYEELDKKK